jgi:hypothetical protein
MQLVNWLDINQLKNFVFVVLRVEFLILIFVRS